MSETSETGFEYSSSTKALFSLSGNSELEKRGVETNVGNPEYFEDKNVAVPVAKYRDKPGYLRIQINATTCILMTGPSGAGKTTADMSIATRTHNRGRIPVNMADTDLHFTNLDNHGGVSKSLIEAMGLFNGESRKEIRQKVLLPKYLADKLRKVPDTVELFTLGFQDVSDSELKFLLGQGLDRGQKLNLESVLQETSMDELSEKDSPFEFLKELCENDEEIHHATAKKLKQNIGVLKDQEIISNRYRKDIARFVDNGYALGLGMKGFGRLEEDDYYLMEFYAKKVTELLIQARLDDRLDKSLMGVLPEAHHLMPRNGDSDFADIVKRNLTFYQRRTDFPMTLDTQNPSHLPKKILDEVNHVFIGCDRNGKSLAKSEWTTVLNKLNVVASHQGEYSEWMRRIQDLRHRDFLYVSPSMTSADEAEIVRFLAPLTSNP